MDAQIFSKKFLDCYEEIDSTGLLWDDDTSYYFLYDQLMSMKKSLSEGQSGDNSDIIKRSAGSLITRIEKYKSDLESYSKLTNDQITRIIALNRIEFLYYQQMHKMQNDMNSVHFSIADKLVQGALATGLNGPYHQLYLRELLDHERIVQVVDDFSKTHPVQEKYGKQVIKEQKIELSEMGTMELIKIAEKVLKETPNEFLARFPVYREGLLMAIK